MDCIGVYTALGNISWLSSNLKKTCKQYCLAKEPNYLIAKHTTHESRNEANKRKK